MGLVQAIWYGIVQGFTEWLPISSTAHLRLVAAFSGWDDPGAAFTAAIQLGTLAAVFVFFWRDLARIAKGWTAGWLDKSRRSSAEFKMGNGMVVGSAPIMVLGYLLKDSIETDWRSLNVIASALIVMGIVLAIAERMGRKERGLEDATTRDGLWIGLWQAVALIPGASRSGCTISGALFAGFDRQSAARYSFLLSSPSVLAAGVYSLYRHRESFSGAILQPVLVANAVSFVVGLASIAVLLRVLAKSGPWIFVAYRIALGATLLFLVQSGRVDAHAGALPEQPTVKGR